MDQNVKDGDCFESGVNVDIHLLSNTYNVGEKSSKCFDRNSLRKHLKTCSGQKLNKCTQCDYTMSHTGNLRIQLKTHNEKK